MVGGGSHHVFVLVVVVLDLILLQIVLISNSLVVVLDVVVLEFPLSASELRVDVESLLVKLVQRGHESVVLIDLLVFLSQSLKLVFVHLDLEDVSELFLLRFLLLFDFFLFEMVLFDVINGQGIPDRDIFHVAWPLLS